LEALGVLEEVGRVLSKAFEELREGTGSGDMMGVRDACERAGWQRLKLSMPCSSATVLRG
jgi:hypothetical protein